MGDPTEKSTPVISPGEKRRFWSWLTGIGLLAFVVFSAFSFISTWAHPGFRAGRPPPPVPVLTADGSESSLEDEAAGRKEILVVSPSCDICTAEMHDRLAMYESSSGPGTDRPEDVLYLVLRSEEMALANFMTAYNRSREIGVGIALIPAEQGRDLGIVRIPALVRLRPDGTVASVSYLREARQRPL